MVVIVAVLYFAKPILLPLALAVLLAFVLTPIVLLLQRRGLGRIPALLVVVTSAFLVVASIGFQGLLVRATSAAGKKELQLGKPVNVG